MYKTIMSILGEDRVKRNVPVKDYCTFKLGGNLEYLIEPTTTIELAGTLQKLTEANIGYKVVGNMSNILPADGINKGVYVSTRRIADNIKCYGTRLVVSAGETIGAICKQAQRLGLSGLEGLVGIPATVGGAIVNNAGAFGYNIGNLVESLLVFDGSKVASISASAADFGYHSSKFIDSGKVILSATIKLAQSSPENVLQKMKEFAIKRASMQPHQPSAGSVFKKVDGMSAGYYIEQVGLKGEIFSGAAISDIHANFIVNLGGATSQSVRYLIKLAQSKVEQKFGVTLQPEIEILGETNESTSRLSHSQPLF